MTRDGSLAGDLMQETFVRHIDHYGEKNPDIPFCIRIACNLFMDDMRRRKKENAETYDEGKVKVHRARL